MGYLDAPRGTGLPALVERWFGTVAGKVSALADIVRSLAEAEVVTVSGDFAMTSEDVINYVGPGGNTITFPPANFIQGRRSRRRVIMNNGTGNVTLRPAGGDRVTASTSTTLPTNAMAEIACDGASLWQILGASFRAFSMTLLGNLSVAGTASVTGRITANGDQVRLNGTTGTTILVLSGPTIDQILAGTAIQQEGALIGDMRWIRFGTGNVVHIGNRVFNTGLTIGFSSTEPLGFWGATPAAQPTAVADATGAGDVVAQLNALLARMRTTGLIAI